MGKDPERHCGRRCRLTVTAPIPSVDARTATLVKPCVRRASGRRRERLARGLRATSRLVRPVGLSRRAVEIGEVRHRLPQLVAQGQDVSGTLFAARGSEADPRGSGFRQSELALTKRPRIQDHVEPCAVFEYSHLLVRPKFWRWVGRTGFREMLRGGNIDPTKRQVTDPDYRPAEH